MEYSLEILLLETSTMFDPDGIPVDVGTMLDDLTSTLTIKYTLDKSVKCKIVMQGQEPTISGLLTVA